MGIFLSALVMIVTLQYFRITYSPLGMDNHFIFLLRVLVGAAQILTEDDTILLNKTQEQIGC